MVRQISNVFEKEQFEANKRAIAGKLQKAVKGLLANSAKRKLSKKEIYLNMKDLIAEDKKAKEPEDESLRGSSNATNSNMSEQQTRDRIKKERRVKKIKAEIDLFRLETVKMYQIHEVICSLQPRKKPYVWIDTSQMEDEERTDRL